MLGDINIFPLPNPLFIFRPEDFLYFSLEHGKRLIAKEVAGDLWLSVQGDGDLDLSVEFPSQHLAEEPFIKSEPVALPSLSRISGKSTINLRVKIENLRIDRITGKSKFKYDLDGLLTMLSTAYFKDGNKTSIEAPYRLSVAPSNSAEANLSFFGAKSKNDFFALWCASFNTQSPLKLTAKNVGPDDGYVTTNSKQKIPIYDNRRQQIAANFNPKHKNPKSFRANYLNLSSLGATFEVEYGEDPVPTVGLRNLSKKSSRLQGEPDIAYWKNVTRLGRDNFVKVTYFCRLWPFGHRCVIVELYKRKLRKQNPISKNTPLPGGNTYSHLECITYLVPVEKTATMTYPEDKNNNNVKVNKPFKSVRILTPISPPILSVTLPGNWVMPETPQASKPNQEGSIKIEYEATDLGGNKQYFSSDAYIVYETDHSSLRLNSNSRLKIRTRAKQSQEAGFPKFPINFPNLCVLTSAKQKIKYATSVLVQKINPEINSASVPVDNSILETEKLILDTSHWVNANLDQLYQGAVMKTATVYIPALNDITSKLMPLEITYRKVPDAQKELGKVFATMETMKDVARKLAFEEIGRIGGLIEPTLYVAGISSEIGIITGKIDSLNKWANEEKSLAVDELKSIFDQESAKILGLFPLQEIINFQGIAKLQEKADGLIQFKNELPQIARQITDSMITSKWTFNTKFLQEPATKDGKNALIGIRFYANSSFKMETTITKKILEAGLPSYVVDSSINNFGLTIADAVTLKFTSLQVRQENDKPLKLTLNPLGGSSFINFENNLAFFDSFKSLFSQMTNFLDSMNKLSEGVITIEYPIVIPNINIGGFGLSKLSINTEFLIPISNPSKNKFNANFRLGKPNDQFFLTFPPYAGTGYLQIGENFAVSISMGAAIVLSFPGAKGGAYALVGFYYGDNKVAIFIQIGAYLTILGMISLSVFILGKLECENHQIYGSITVYVEFKVWIFKKTFSHTADYSISGGGASSLGFYALNDKDSLLTQPQGSQAYSFNEVIGERPGWEKYCACFND